MENEKDAVIVFLESYLALRREVARMEEKIKDLEALCYRSTAQITGMPGGGSGSKAVWDTLADTRSKALATMQTAVERSQEIEDFVDRIENETYRAILKYKYLDGLTFVQIAGKLYYTERHLRRLHGYAKDAARELWNRLGMDKQVICAATGRVCSYCTPGPCESRRGA